LCLCEIACPLRNLGRATLWMLRPHCHMASSQQTPTRSSWKVRFIPCNLSCDCLFFGGFKHFSPYPMTANGAWFGVSRMHDRLSSAVHSSTGQLALSHQRPQCDEHSPMFPFNCPVVPPIPQQPPHGVPSLPSSQSHSAVPAIMPPVTPTPMTTIIVTVSNDPYPAYLVPVLASLIVIIALANNPLYSWLCKRPRGGSKKDVSSQPFSNPVPRHVSMDAPDIDASHLDPSEIGPALTPAPNSQPRMGGSLVIHQDKAG
jgi:hypothetical protein